MNNKLVPLYLNFMLNENRVLESMYLTFFVFVFSASSESSSVCEPNPDSSIFWEIGTGDVAAETIGFLFTVFCPWIGGRDESEVELERVGEIGGEVVDALKRDRK